MTAKTARVHHLIFAHNCNRMSTSDAAVMSLVLCSVASHATSLHEILRVLRKGGELRFYEHVLADDSNLARV